MTLKNVVKTIYRVEGLRGLLRYFSPILNVRGQTMIMLPHWYNGHFSMRSLNKFRGAKP